MALSEAEQRRKRFLANKEKHDGNYYAMQKAEYEKDHTVYFLEDGTITCITKEEIEPNETSEEAIDYEQEAVNIQSELNMFK